MEQSNLTPAQLREFYETEKALAARLRHASKGERLKLYQEVYDELYRRVPFHPMLTRKATPEESARAVSWNMEYLSRFLHPGMTVLEVGAGDCQLAFEVARQANKVYAVEVSNVIAHAASTPANFELVMSDGTNIPVPPGSVDLAYSNQLIEHLHPDDAIDQLNNIFRALRPGGIYLCNTAHRLCGPTDVSQHFDEVATGFHLKEYVYAELDQLFRAAGFNATRACIRKSGRWILVPMGMMLPFERLAMKLFGHKSYAERQRWTQRRPFNVFPQGINIVGYKA